MSLVRERVDSPSSVSRQPIVPECLLVFTRHPTPGSTKTRLIPALGAAAAAELQHRLTQRTLLAAGHATHAQGRSDRAVEVHFAGGDEAALRKLYGPRWHYCRQSEGDLGERLESATTCAFIRGAERVVVVGTDCPRLDSTIIQAAFQALARADVVVGPAADGGYYLLGMRRNQPELFRAIDWQATDVLAQTVARAREQSAVIHYLPTLSDVDYVEDLLDLRLDSGLTAGILPEIVPGRLSVVIPTYNEREEIERCLAQFAATDNVEVIVADGSSSDGTVELARQCGARTVVCKPGRGRQLNAGAAIASGEVVLFLHADSRLPRCFLPTVWDTLSRGAVAGAFRLRIAHPHRGFRCIEGGANLRAQFLQMPYGDQGLFLRTRDFIQAGGFPHWPLMEDYELVCRLRRLGRIRICPSAVLTSPRRWLKQGLVRTTLVNQLCIAGYHCGVSPERLARFYGNRVSSC